MWVLIRILEHLGVSMLVAKKKFSQGATTIIADEMEWKRDLWIQKIYNLVPRDKCHHQFFFIFLVIWLNRKNKFCR